MQSKEKRKINPRRRLLIRLILVIVAIATVLVLGLRALKPKGAQIVYIAPDENGYDAIWLADLNDPENPRQLTFHEGMFIRNLQVSEGNSVVFYMTISTTASIYNDFWILNLDTGEHANVPLCETEVCGYFRLQSDGRWLAFQEFSLHYERVIRVVVQNLETLERRTLFDMLQPPSPHLQPLPQWLGTTDRLAFRIASSERNLGDDEFAFYSIEEDQIINTESLNVPFYTPNFSDDGSFYNSITIQSMYPSSQVDPRLPFISNTQNPTQVIYEAESSSEIIADWHPNNEYVLLNRNASIYPSELIIETVLHNLDTDESDVLFSVEDSIPLLTFNFDGSQILYSISIMGNNNTDQFMLFDMETREEIILPIVGRSPQWVNGGR